MTKGIRRITSGEVRAKSFIDDSTMNRFAEMVAGASSESIGLNNRP